MDLVPLAFSQQNDECECSSSPADLLPHRLYLSTLAGKQVSLQLTDVVVQSRHGGMSLCIGGLIRRDGEAYKSTRKVLKDVRRQFDGIGGERRRLQVRRGLAIGSVVIQGFWWSVSTSVAVGPAGTGRCRVQGCGDTSALNGVYAVFQHLIRCLSNLIFTSSRKSRDNSHQSYALNSKLSRVRPFIWALFLQECSKALRVRVG